MLIFLSNFTIREALSKWLTILESECSFGSLLNLQTVFDEIHTEYKINFPALIRPGRSPGFVGSRPCCKGISNAERLLLYGPAPFHDRKRLCSGPVSVHEM